MRVHVFLTYSKKNDSQKFESSRKRVLTIFSSNQDFFENSSLDFFYTRYLLHIFHAKKIEYPKKNSNYLVKMATLLGKQPI